ncbi:hypothetical protein ACZ87_03575, partial [Candidatus Erwinia dacicola]
GWALSEEAIQSPNHQVIVHDAEYRQRRYAFGEINEFRLLNMFEIGRRYIELPAVIAVFRMKPDCRRFP